MLYKLSWNGAFAHFKKVYFFSCRKDGICPYNSARVQMPEGETKGIHAQISLEMCKNLLESCSGQVIRVEVVFDTIAKDWKSFIGRKEHISFTDSLLFLRAFVRKYVIEWCKPDYN